MATVPRSNQQGAALLHVPGPLADWSEVVKAYEDRAGTQRSRHEPPKIDIHSL